MNQATITTAVGAMAAALLAASDVMLHDRVGDVHTKIDDVRETTVTKSRIELVQLGVLDELTAIKDRLKLLEQLHIVAQGHEHQEDEP